MLQVSPPEYKPEPEPERILDENQSTCISCIHDKWVLCLLISINSLSLSLSKKVSNSIHHQINNKNTKTNTK